MYLDGLNCGHLNLLRQKTYIYMSLCLSYYVSIYLIILSIYLSIYLDGPELWAFEPAKTEDI